MRFHPEIQHTCFRGVDTDVLPPMGLVPMVLFFLLFIVRKTAWPMGRQEESVSCQRDICFRVAPRKARQAANQKATKTADSEAEKLQQYKNSFFVLCSARMENLD